MSSFYELGLSASMLKAVQALGYEEPTPVQAQAIPAVLAGNDVVAGAKTGTGKTAAFSLPCMDMIEARAKHDKPQMLVLSPTRELAQQTAEVCTSIAAVTKHRILCVVGGLSQRPQVQKLKKGVDVLIATPGRLIDLKNQGYVDLSHVSVFILDEADRMLDMGFAPDIHRIAEYLPEQHQTLLFSATIDDAVEKSIGKLLYEPQRIEVAKRGEVADTVKQSIIRVPHNLKASLLVALLKERGSSRVIVFARTRGRADTCARRLCKAGIPAAAIHSDRSQAQRRRALNQFEEGKIDVLVGTDVLARGIDVDNVSYVVNFDLPMEAQDYVHRIGRTGRAGASGEAISFVSPDNKRMLKDIQRLIKQTIPEVELDSFDLEQAQEEAMEHAFAKTAKDDPEVIAAEKEVKARKKRKEKAKTRKANEKQAAHQAKKKDRAIDAYVKTLESDADFASSANDDARATFDEKPRKAAKTHAHETDRFTAEEETDFRPGRSGRKQAKKGLQKTKKSEFFAKNRANEQDDDYIDGDEPRRARKGKADAFDDSSRSRSRKGAKASKYAERDTHRGKKSARNFKDNEAHTGKGSQRNGESRNNNFRDGSSRNDTRRNEAHRDGDRFEKDARKSKGRGAKAEARSNKRNEKRDAAQPRFSKNNGSHGTSRSESRGTSHAGARKDSRVNTRSESRDRKNFARSSKRSAQKAGRKRSRS